MADNPYVNKVQYGNQVLIDITDSTVEPNALLAGYKAYGADGAPVTGTLQLTYHITLHNAQYEALSDAVKEADENYFYIDDLDNVGVEMDDTVISASKVWSSQKVNNEIDAINSNITTLGDYDILATSTSTASEQKSITNLANYRYVCAFLVDTAIRGCTSFVPTGLFKTIGGLVVIYSAMAGASLVTYSGVIIYNSDTSVNMYRASAGQTLYLVGIK